MEKIKVGIIDDNYNLRRLLKDLMVTEADIECVGEAENLEEAQMLVKSQQPHVVILDISIDENYGGLYFLKRLQEFSPATKVIMLSSYDENILASQSIKAGAKGYVCKDKTVPCLIDAIRSVFQGKEYVSGSA